ncbi:MULTISPECIES: helix-turn-helix domain-containing protein [unclassified Methanoregula]|uniref:helix-turn-helix domain-containing protein n=1 Tax=unclassified Methanoregula TaxID=2649730 RepID=UPI0009C6AC12|nr:MULTISPECIES: helix-turn-helix domain-containing protein [unclassified Methanoregula]OPX64877.1 MAG: HTH DNA binding domain protein [Methanoregula sp. PtaB.Bin085]OPY32929.1 MAG: HTH DNA binding domain protein [Methanoregula sp. PtaU1.Bin006]
MRKLTVSVTLNAVFAGFIRATAGFYEKIEVLEILREDTAKGYTLGIARILLTEEQSPDKVRFPPHFRILDTFESHGREHVCLVKVSMPPQFRSMLHWTDVDVVWERPLHFTQKSITFSCTGPEPALEKVMQFARFIGTVTSVAYEAADYRGYRILPQLTEKERLVLMAAIGDGYYEYPRRISATELAEKLGYSKSTLIEYLRRAENKVITTACTGDL